MEEFVDPRGFISLLQCTYIIKKVTKLLEIYEVRKAGYIKALGEDFIKIEPQTFLAKIIRNY